MSFNYALIPNPHSTVSPDDYVAVSGQIIQFNIRDTSHTLTLSIANDGMCETPSESFYVRISLVSSTGSITISPSQAQCHNCWYSVNNIQVENTEKLLTTLWFIHIIDKDLHTHNYYSTLHVVGHSYCTYLGCYYKLLKGSSGSLVSWASYGSFGSLVRRIPMVRGVPMFPGVSIVPGVPMIPEVP